VDQATNTTGRLEVRVSERTRGQLYMMCAALAWSSAGLLQRNLHADAATQTAGRALFAGIAVGAFVAFTTRGGIVASFRSIGRAGVACAICLAVSSGSFLLALNFASVATVLVIQALVPFPAAILGWVFLREPVARRTWLAMLVALVGVVVIVGGPGGGLSLGMAIAAFMTFAFACAIVLARSRADVSMAPATCLAQFLIVIVFAPIAHLGELGSTDLTLLVGLGFGQLGLGLVFMTFGARLIPAADVALFSLLESVLGPVWVWLALGEAPAPATMVGGLLIIAAVVVTVGRIRRAREVAVLP
jgi:drug/metabolite transporter (DMT)-like permease